MKKILNENLKKKESAEKILNFLKQIMNQGNKYKLYLLKNKDKIQIYSN